MDSQRRPADWPRPKATRYIANRTCAHSLQIAEADDRRRSGLLVLIEAWVVILRDAGESGVSETVTGLLNNECRFAIGSWSLVRRMTSGSVAILSALFAAQPASGNECDAIRCRVKV